ncbi:MAG: oligosaccharide flippase family protein [Clostridiales bacterium]|nr:oligosaccharide flippase family protein [Clostridiales bacterium]
MRTKKSIKNIMFALGGQILNSIITFISRTIFIYILGSDYLGINGLFTNILSMLSLAELGVGSAIIYSMYKPLADNDEYKISALMNLYSKAYKIIGAVVAVIGISLTPFLGYIIKDKPNVDNLTFIYLLFLLDSVLSYYFAYKRSIITADQKNYLNTINQQTFNIIKFLGQVLILLVTKNYILYLLVQIVCNFLSNIFISIKSDKLYPYLKLNRNAELKKEEKSLIFRNVRAMMSHKVGGVVVNSTDNILISSFVGVYWVGIYSNYVMITGVINSVLYQVFTALTASVGNLNVSEDKEKSKNIFYITFFLNFWIYSFCSICLWILLNPFITMWIGEEFMLSKNVVFIIVFNFFISGMRQTTIMYNTTLGLFWNDRFKPWFEAAINLVASLVLLKYFGILGVFLGTLISTITTSFWVEPYILYKYNFGKGLLKYFSKYFIYLFITIISGVITTYICSNITGNDILSLIYRLVICLLIPNGIYLIVFFKTYEFKYILANIIMPIIKK